MRETGTNPKAISIFPALVLAVFAGLLMLTQPASCKTTSSETGKPVSKDALQLTKQKVKDWIQTRIAVAKLQRNMQAHAADYEHLIHAFYAKRKTLLESRDWTVAEFEAVQDRITAAISGMDIADDLAESKPDYEADIEDIKSNEYFSAEQKKQLIQSKKNLREQRRSLYVEPTKKDWPAVRPYRKVMEELTDWYAGNTSKEPVIK